MAKYSPPSQSKLSQMIDVVVVMALAIGTLFLPLKLGLSGGAKVSKPLESPTWEALGQNPVMVEKWTALGFADPASAQGFITSRYDYSFSAMNLLVMVVVVVGYFVLMLKFSEKEYRDVIDEKFGSGK